MNLSAYVGETKGVKDKQEAAKELYEAHDLVTIDILSHLIAQGAIQGNIEMAPHGSLVIGYGTLLFIDGQMVRLALTSWDALVEVAEPKDRKALKKSSISPGNC